MLSRIYNIMLFLVICTISVSAQKGLTNFTDAKIGEKLRALGSESVDFRLYVFLNDGSCAQCMPILKQIEAQFSSRFKMQSIMFFNSENDLQMKVFKEAFPNYKFIQDPVGAYMDLYKIKVAPMIAILDNEGTVLFLGCPNSAANFDSQRLITVFNSVKPGTLAASDLKQIYEKELKDTNGSSLSFAIYSATYLENENKYLIADYYNYLIYTLDNNFNIINRVQFDTNGQNALSLALTKGYNSSSNISLTLSIRRVGVKQFIYNPGKAIFENQATILGEKRFWVGYESYANSDSIIYIPSYPEYIISDYNRDSLPYAIFSYNRKTKELKSFGKFEPITWATNRMYTYTSPKIYCDRNENIYFKVGLYDTMRVYSKTGELVKSFQVLCDTNYFRNLSMEYIKKMTINASKSELEESLLHISSLKELMKDEKANILYCIYSNTVKDKAGNVVKEYFIHGLDPENGKAIGKDIKLPGLAVPISIYNNIITTFENSGDKMIFKKFELVR